MNTCYYKTNDPGAVVTWDRVFADRAALHADIAAFAARFGAEGDGYTNSARFTGLRFKQPPSRVHWTAPDARRLQRPRVRVHPHASVAERAAHAVLLAEWEQRPLAQVSDKPIFRALGCSRDFDFYLHGFKVFKYAGWLYVATAAPMPALTEITGSEFGQAEEAAL